MERVADQPPPSVNLRVSDDEKAEWQAAALLDGEKKLGTWIKKLVRERIARQKKQKPKNPTP